MNIKYKKVISIMLLTVMFFTSMNFSNFNKVEAATNGHSADAAIEYIQSLNGQTVGSGQCVALITAYYNYLGQKSPSYYYAKELANKANEQPAGWQTLKGVQPQKGDILIYLESAGNIAGHVAIYESDYVTWHQNYGGEFVRRITNHYTAMYDKSSNVMPYWGVVRPDFTNSSLAIDTVTEGRTYTVRFSNKENYFDISGWAMTDVDGAFIQMYIDDKLAVAAHLVERYNRPDVSTKPNVGYKFKYNYGDLLEGTHTLKVICHEPNNGNALAQKSVNFNIIHADMAIDTVREGNTYIKTSDSSKNYMDIKGWSATKKNSFVQMYVDGKLAAATNTITRTRRDDIIGYDKAGYEKRFYYSNLSEGKHTLEVTTFEEGTNQVLISQKVTFNIAEREILLGDVNNDGKVNTVDAVKILQYVAKKTTLTENQMSAANVNKDNKVNTVDAVKILQYVAKKITKF